MEKTFETGQIVVCETPTSVYPGLIFNPNTSSRPGRYVVINLEKGLAYNPPTRYIRLLEVPTLSYGDAAKIINAAHLRRYQRYSKTLDSRTGEGESLRKAALAEAMKSMRNQNGD